MLYQTVTHCADSWKIGKLTFVHMLILELPPEIHEKKDECHRDMVTWLVKVNPTPQCADDLQL